MSPSEAKKITWRNLIEIRVFDNDIILITPIRITKIEDPELFLSDFVEIHRTILELTQGRPYRQITDFSNSYFRLNLNVLEELATDSVINNSKIAEAVIIESLGLRMLLGDYLKLLSKNTDTKSFFGLDDAISWIREK